jgi:hypothetical protein
VLFSDVRFGKPREEQTPFVEISREIEDIISMQVIKEIANYDLETKVVGLSADDTNTNFEGLLRKGRENVFTKIKSQLNRKPIGFGCNEHIIPNCAKAALDSMPVDIEVLATKICVFSHTHRSCRTPKRFL